MAETEHTFLNEEKELMKPINSQNNDDDEYDNEEYYTDNNEDDNDENTLNTDANQVLLVPYSDDDDDDEDDMGDNVNNDDDDEDDENYNGDIENDDEKAISNETCALFLKQIWDKILKMGDDVKRLMLIDGERHNTMLQTLEKLVGDKKILNEAKQTAAEGELLEGHATMMDSVARKPAHATDDIIQFTKKKKNYLKEQKALSAATPAPPPAEDGDGDATQFKKGSVAAADRVIRSFLKNKGVKETDKGVKIGGKTLNFAYDDMIEDLTRNVKTTSTNLIPSQHTKLLTELKKLRMPVAYIRSQKLKNQYRDIIDRASNGSEALPSTSSPPPPYTTPRRPQSAGPQHLNRKGQLRPFMNY
ncbi:Hypothetical predicted protein [Paramuricea clavata]|uniref:Uncharacterized protein n=1 Tax=Paramuricea clavata TaxID=317549 RepID=A0A7D9JI80_PARCT|nr:Hypothetical predicted protein [Paramuricea clavata]